MQGLSPISTDAILSDAQTLPASATNVNSTNSVFIGGNSSGELAVSIFAHTDISIADSKALTIAVLGGTTSTATTATYRKIYDRTASGAVIAFSAGDLIASFIIPKDFYDSFDYIRLNYAVTADESSESVDALVHITQ